MPLVYHVKYDFNVIPNYPFLLPHVGGWWYLKKQLAYVKTAYSSTAYS